MVNEDLHIKLTPKEEKFSQEFVRTGNKTEAYRLSYSTKNMTDKTINEKACRLSKRDKVRARIEQLRKQLVERSKMTIDECVQRFTSMARFELSDVLNDDGTVKDLKDIPEDSRMAIEDLVVEEIKVEGTVIGHVKKIKLSSRRENLKELLKVLGGYEKDNKQKTERLPTREERDSFLEGIKKEIMK